MKTKGILLKIRKSVFTKAIALKLILLMLVQLLPFTQSETYALTSGPGQQEYASFEPASTTDMVNLYDGSFTYNIPIMNIPGPNGGYPINLAYHSGVGMDEEASWVGLGWTLNVGAISRYLQGVPDDFQGEEIEYEFNQRSSKTISMDASFLLEKPDNGVDDYNSYFENFGIPNQIPPPFGWNYFPTLQIHHNNYSGLGYRISVTPKYSKIDDLTTLPDPFSASLNLSFDSESGIGISPSFSIDRQKKNFDFKWNIGLNYNSRSGLSSFSSSFGFNSTKNSHVNSQRKTFVVNGGSSLNYQYAEAIQSISIPRNNISIGVKLQLPGEAFDIATYDPDDDPSTTNNINVPHTFLVNNITNPLSNFQIQELSFNYSISELSNNGEYSAPAYGYLYNNNTIDVSISDYSRGGTNYNKKSPFLPTSKVTHDAFMVTGQGTGGMFRAYDKNVRSFSDSKMENKHTSFSLGAEFGKTTANSSKHIGINVGNLDLPVNILEFSTKDYTGDWNEGTLNDIGSIGGNHFKMYGEQSGVLLSDDNTDSWGNDDAVRYDVGISNLGFMDRQYTQTDDLLYYDGASANATAPTTVNDQTRKANVIKYLTDAEAQKFGFSRNSGGSSVLKYYNMATSSWVSKSFTRQDNHISEVQVLQQDGSRYVYALPAYNETQSEVTMSVPDNDDFNTPVVDVASNTHDNTLNQYFNKVTKPAYAHSWLLTAVVSSDYIDADNIPGPSDGDMGYWVKFNYKKTESEYEWRIPYEGGNFLEGNKDDVSDNMASFSYGKKELYYIHSIETKTHIAVFTTSDRDDARGAVGEYTTVSSSVGTTKMQRLDNVRLYLKKDYLDNDVCELNIADVNTGAKPLQTVEFTYDYSLCQNIENTVSSTTGQKGKLTLLSVKFSSENSDRGELSPYEFTYTGNKPYDIHNMDRWGNFKDNTGTFSNDIYPFTDFPYTDYDGTVSSKHALPEDATWALSTITLPTGGTIEVNYESNDYAYVEDKPAMKMMDIVAVGNRIVSNDIDELADNLLPALYQEDGTTETDFNLTMVERDIATSRYAYLEHKVENGYRIFFELDKPVTSSELSQYSSAAEYVKLNYIGNQSKISFMNTSVLKVDFANSNLVKDYVSGYVDIYTEKYGDTDFFGLCKVDGSTDYNVGYFSIREVDLKSNPLPNVKCNPMTRMAIEHMQLQRPDVATDFFAQNNVNTGNHITDAILQSSSFVFNTLSAYNDVLGMVLGYNLWAYAKQNGAFIELNGKSKIRLQDPDGKKQGGGSRVSKIVMHDNWVNENSSDNSSYGLSYFYDENGDGTGKSTGVAYEPPAGKEESALHQPIEYEYSTLLKNPNTLYTELPHMENYYPGASVGYGKVTVKSISIEESSGDNEHSVAPISVYEFFTPKDFPVYGDQTDINPEKGLLGLIPIPGFYTDYRFKKVRTQGYSIITNNMAGKLKTVSQYSRNFTASTGADDIGDFISSQTYVYNTVDDYAPDKLNKLSSKVQVLSVDNETSETFFQTALLGQSVDVFNERNENQFNQFGINFSANWEILPAPVVPTFWPSVSKSELSYKSLVTHKIIHRSGILKKVITKTDNSSIVTENIAFDLETGEPLLTKVYNQYDDPVYSLSYPAHWYYPNMGAAHKNEELRISLTSTSATSGAIDVGSSNIGKFVVGDEIFIDYASVTDVIAHITFVDVANNDIYCIDKDGALIANGTVDAIKMKSSGYKNHLGVAAGGITTKLMTGFDYDDHTSAIQFTLSKILNASAVEFSDVWQAPCYDCNGSRSYIEDGTFVNPYVRGLRGLWRVKRSYAYNTDRIYQDNSKEDGVFADYQPFTWHDPTAKSDKWVLMNTVTKYSPFGFELENKDALNNYSSALYGYDNSLVTAIASNSRFHEMFFDGFEDYYSEDGEALCANCKDDHFRIASTPGQISGNEAHSGNYSIVVNGGTSISETTPAFNYNTCSDTIGASYQIPDNENPRYEKDSCDCVGEFSPRAIDNSTTKKFTFSAWMKHDGTYFGTPVSYDDDVFIKLTFYNSTTGTIGSPVEIKPTTKFKIIEGWQKLEKDVVLPAGTKRVKVELINNVSSSIAYFDDLRMHPFDGNMNSYVYDRATMKLMAELDANNYATFYIYDEAGNLVKMKKETEKGIKTITEGRKDIPKNQ